MKVWRPKGKRDRAVIKLTLWAGLCVWMVFTLALGVVYARQFALYLPMIMTEDTLIRSVLSWVGPIWIVFTTLMLIWAVARFANKYLGRGIKVES